MVACLPWVKVIAFTEPDPMTFNYWNPANLKENFRLNDRPQYRHAQFDNHDGLQSVWQF
jgi:hypothetical protein